MTTLGAEGSGRLDGADLTISSAIALAWVAWFAATGTIQSGYHLVDDHEIVRIASDLRSRPDLDVLREWLVRDLGFRFRPLYVVHRVAEARVFGDDFTAWGLYTAFLGVTCSVLLYLSMRRLRFPRVAALVFAFFALCGPQASIWWRLGPNETVGMVALSVGLLGLAGWSRTGSRRSRLLFWVGAALASLCKESFVALLPALALANVWSVVAQRGVSWRQASATCRPDLAILAALLVTESALIVFVVGTDDIGYAGVQGLTLHQVWKAVNQLVGGSELLALAAIAAFALALGRNVGPGWPWRRRDLLVALELAALLIASQALLYGKSGLHERYLVPGSLAVALLLALAVRTVQELFRAGRAEPERARRPWVTRGRAPVVALIAGVLLLPLASRRASAMVRGASYYSADGRETAAFLDALARFARDREILVAGSLPGVYEQFWSLRWYLAVRLGKNDVRFLFVPPSGPLTPFQEGVVERFHADPFFPKYVPGPEVPPVVAVLRGEEEAFLRSASWFMPSAYVRHALPGTFAVFTMP